jgi:Protein of unknown function (DUF1501)
MSTSRQQIADETSALSRAGAEAGEIAGGGITGGRVLGESDKDGMFVKDTPVQVPDLLATLYKKLGIDYEKEYKSNIGRPIKIGADGRPLDFLMS